MSTSPFFSLSRLSCLQSLSHDEDSVLVVCMGLLAYLLESSDFGACVVTGWRLNIWALCAVTLTFGLLLRHVSFIRSDTGKKLCYDYVVDGIQLVSERSSCLLIFAVIKRTRYKSGSLSPTATNVEAYKLVFEYIIYISVKTQGSVIQHNRHSIPHCE